MKGEFSLSSPQAVSHLSAVGYIWYTSSQLRDLHIFTPQLLFHLWLTLPICQISSYLHNCLFFNVTLFHYPVLYPCVSVFASWFSFSSISFSNSTFSIIILHFIWICKNTDVNSIPSLIFLSKIITAYLFLFTLRWSFKHGFDHLPISLVLF